MPENTLPEVFVERLKAIVSLEDYPATLASFAEPSATAFRVNTLKATNENVLAEIGVETNSVPWYPQAFLIDPQYRDALTQSKAFSEGRIYIQNLASMLAPLLLDPQPGEEVLDLAAAPGGKTLMIAAMMENHGRLAAVESVKNRFFRLKNTIQTFGADMVELYLKDGREVGWKVLERFDRVLLDAPCSSESRFNVNDPKSFSHWNERKIKEVQRKQKKLICSAIAALKPGGVLVYSTCAYSPEENEMVVQHALKKFSGKILIEPAEIHLDNFRPGLLRWKKKEFDPSMKQAIRVLPNQFMHGFFLCKIRKICI
ncbi:MAG: RsmB/NOP family class I SAM-dependent RNA methyltransferase [Pseudomonadales bacterium]